jgi:hypothetical protein
MTKQAISCSSEEVLEHPYFAQLCERLQVDSKAMFMHLVDLWMFMGENGKDGVLPRDASVIAAAAGWHGDAVTFCNELQQVDFMNECFRITTRLTAPEGNAPWPRVHRHHQPEK